ncbi:MAG: hypothetical protein P4L93_02455 [Coriobacteriia bacterium]|nr:hypothetical protein [Coriobacteriia bacterium]
MDIEVTVPGFSGGYTTCIESSDFRRFEQELEQLERGGEGRTATLANPERDLCVQLNLGGSGHGQGRYRFDVSPRGPVSTSVVGAFLFESSLLPALQRGAAELSGHHSAHVKA